MSPGSLHGRAQWETRFLLDFIFTGRRTHPSQFRAVEVAVTIRVQVLKQRFHQEALLGGRVSAAGPLRAWLQAGLQCQKDILQAGVVGHGAGLAWRRRGGYGSETPPQGVARTFSSSGHFLHAVQGGGGGGTGVDGIRLPACPPHPIAIPEHWIVAAHDANAARSLPSTPQSFTEHLLCARHRTIARRTGGVCPGEFTVAAPQ